MRKSVQDKGINLESRYAACRDEQEEAGGKARSQLARGFRFGSELCSSSTAQRGGRVM